MSINANNTALNEILSMINNLPSVDGSGGGMVYTNIVYNDDNTVTLTDKDGVDHTMVCEYTDGVLSGLTYDGKSVELTYEEDALVNIGTVEVDMANVPIESGGGGTEEIEQIIDQSGVLDSTDGTATEKVEQLIDYADLFKKARGVIFMGSNIETITMDCLNMTNLNSAFDGCRNIKEIHLSNTQNVKTWQYFLYSCNSLTTVETLDLSGRSGRNSWIVAGIDDLQTFKVVPETIKTSINVPAPKLSAESVQSIVDGLAYVETSQNLTLHRGIVLTDNQKQVINAKGWTLIQ